MPQGVDQLVEVFRLVDTAVPVQVVDVPKIPQDRIPQRSAPRSLQQAEQLVHVPVPKMLEVSRGRDSWRCMVRDRCEGEGVSTGGSWAHGTPSGPRRWDSPPAQGCILGSAAVPKIQEQIVETTGDVPVTMLHKFQQSVPQIHSFDRVLAIPVLPQ